MPVFLQEGNGQVVQVGEEVWNLGVTSCGLVLGFGSIGVAAYHWPFMTDKDGYFQTFRRLVDQVGVLDRIEIYTNPMPGGSTESYEATTRKIRKQFGVHTIHYIYGNSIRGVDVSLTVTNPVTNVNPGVSSTFLDLA